MPLELTVPGEARVNNNISNGIDRISGAGCGDNANIDVGVSNSGVGCDDEVIYTINVCNTAPIRGANIFNKYPQISTNKNNYYYYYYCYSFFFFSFINNNNI